MKKYHSIISIIAITAMIALNLGFISNAEAAQLTQLKDTLSTVKASTAADHTIQFITPTGVAAAGTVTVTFPTGFTMGSVAFGDVDFAEGNSSCASFADKTLAAAPSGATWGAVVSGQVLTLTSGSGTVTAGDCLQIEVGTNATYGTAGANQVTNSAAGNDKKMDVTAGASDSASLAISIISNDIVAVTATVNPTLTFTIDDNAIGFGVLSSSAATYANGAATGSSSDTTAHNLTVATNAATGYVLTYNGATLTNGSNTISVMSNTTSSVGAEQFGISVAVSGGTTNSTIATGYANSSPVWTFVAGTTTTIVSRTSPTVTETIAAHYLANISNITEPGSYSTNITYVATGIF